MSAMLSALTALIAKRDTPLPPSPRPRTVGTEEPEREGPRPTTSGLLPRTVAVRGGWEGGVPPKG
jgi:hypothetical protein